MIYYRFILLLFTLLLLQGCGGGGGDTATTSTQQGTIHFLTPAYVTVNENTVFVITLRTDSQTATTFQIVSGADQQFFNVERTTGKLSFIQAPDFEAPRDSNGDNIYEVTLEATNTKGASAQQTLNITVRNIDDTPPVFRTPSNISITENRVVVTTVQTEDESSVTYTLAGDDAGSFIIDQERGKLKFKTAPNFESALDTNRDNVYQITITAGDTEGNQANMDMNITVTDLAESAANDTDDDYVPDNIELLIGSDMDNPDMDGNGIEDGLDTAGSYGDTFFDKLWHIRSLGTATNRSGVETIVGNDLDVLPLMHQYLGYNKGENMIVQVVDNGVDSDHEDLEENMDLTRSYNGQQTGDPSGRDSHGTMVAGIIAARAFNGKGVRGITPFAKIAGSNWLRQSGQSIAELEKVWLTGEGANEIAVSNNSWGIYFDTDTDYENIMAQGAATLRGGKGRLYVFAAGNDRDINGDANLQYSLSNRFAIAVAAMKHDNTYADYSTPGSNLLVSAYGGNYYEDSPTIGTTTIMGNSNHVGTVQTQTTWSEDIQENYTFVMNGTSAAAPMVSASIALVLEACPALTWRDVRYLIARHAKQVDTANPTWSQNAAGLWHSTDYGFGLINPKGMIEDCTAGYTLLPAEVNTAVSKDFNLLIPDDNTPHTFDLNVTEQMTIEWVEVTIDNNNRYASDYRITLSSAQGTQTTLIKEGSQSPSWWMDGGFRFGSAAFIGEESNGTWHVTLTDRIGNNAGTLKRIAIKIYGHR